MMFFLSVVVLYQTLLAYEFYRNCTHHLFTSYSLLFNMNNTYRSITQHHLLICTYHHHSCSTQQPFYEVDDKLMDFWCIYHQKGHFSSFPIHYSPMCSTFGFLSDFFVNIYHNRPFHSHISVHYATSLHCVECTKQVLFDHATSIRFVDQTLPVIYIPFVMILTIFLWLMAY